MRATRHSKQLYLLADKSKPGKVRLALFGELFRLDANESQALPAPRAAFVGALLTIP